MRLNSAAKDMGVPCAQHSADTAGGSLHPPAGAVWEGR